MRRSEKRKSEKKEEAGARKGRKVALTLFLTDLWPWRVEKSPCFGALLEFAMSKKCTPLWHEAHVPVKMYQTHQVRTTLEVAMSKKCTPLWHEAHVPVKMYQTRQVRTTLEVAMSKKCTPLWPEAHFQVKMYQTHQVRTTLEVAMSKRCTPLWPEAHFQGKMMKIHMLDHIWTFRCRFAWQVQGIAHLVGKLAKRVGFVSVSATTTNTVHYTALHHTTLYPTALHYTTLHPTTHTTLQDTSFSYTTLRYTTLHIPLTISTTKRLNTCLLQNLIWWRIQGLKVN